MKLRTQTLLFFSTLWSLAASASLRRAATGVDAGLRVDGAVSSRFSSESVTEANVQAREERLEKMEEQIQAMAAELAEQRAAMKTGHELASSSEVNIVPKLADSAPGVSSSSLNSSSAAAFVQQPFPGGWDGANLPPQGVRVPPFYQAWWNPRFEYGRNVVLSIITTILCLLFAWWLYAEISTTPEEAETPRDKLKRTVKDVEQDTYGFAIVSLVRDLQMTATGAGQPALRQARIAAAIALLFFTFALQVFITLQVKKFVTAKCVYNIRHDYEAYQAHMYGDDPEAYTIGTQHPIFPVYAGRRGNPGYFMPGNFVTLDESVKEGVCNIPFSQTPFFLCVLLIWSLTCVMEVRLSISTFRSLVLNTKTIDSMKDALEDVDPDIDDSDPENRWVVDGLTVWVKMAITVLILLPRVLLVCFLLWLGCRFLAATNDFGEMVLNAVALEFVLLIKDLLYTTVVPDRNKREIEKISVRPSSSVEFASYWTYLGTFSWGFVAMAWIFYYVFLIQMVLPQYRWDVAPVCTTWLAKKYGPYA